MKTKEILKRSYYALTIALIMFGVYLMVLSVNPFWPYRSISLAVLLSLCICWVMTRHNKPSYFKWYAGIIVALALTYIYLPMILFKFILAAGDLALILKHILFVGCSVCAVMSTFLSNTKYSNILPNQSKGVNGLFRGLSWLGQFIVWGYSFLLFLSVIGIIR